MVKDQGQKINKIVLCVTYFISFALFLILILPSFNAPLPF